MTIRQTITIAALAWVAALGGCSNPPENLDVALSKRTDAGRYQVTLEPPEQAPAINQLHGWTVKLATPDGVAVPGASFVVGGGMPQHGHGFPTQPRVTRELSAGHYRLDGMKFSMTGWWEVKLDVRGPLGADTVTFNTVVDSPRAQP